MEECNRGLLIVGSSAHSRRGVWKASQPEILLNVVAMPAGALSDTEKNSCPEIDSGEFW